MLMQLNISSRGRYVLLSLTLLEMGEKRARNEERERELQLKKQTKETNNNERIFVHRMHVKNVTFGPYFDGKLEYR